MRPQAFIFDLDGVLTDTARLHYLAWKRLSDELGLQFDEQQNEALKGVSRLGSFEIILANNGKSEAYTLAQKEALAERKNEYYRALVETLTEEDILPGIAELLGELRKAGIPTAVASVSKNAPRVLERIGLADTFDVVADAARIRRSKPDPEIFLTCAEQLGVEPSACIGIEDSQAGIDAIVHGGMYAVGICVTGEGEAPHWMVGSTAELVFDKLMARFDAWSQKGE